MSKKFLSSIDAGTASVSNLSITSSANLGPNTAAGTVASAVNVPAYGIQGQISIDKVRSSNLLKTTPLIASLFNPTPVQLKAYIKNTSLGYGTFVNLGSMTYDSTSKIQTVAVRAGASATNSNVFNSVVNAGDYFYFLGSGSSTAASGRYIFGQVLSASNTTASATGSLTFYNANGITTSTAASVLNGTMVVFPASGWTNSSFDATFGSILGVVHTIGGSYSNISQTHIWVLKHNFNTIVIPQVVTSLGRMVPTTSLDCYSLENYDATSSSQYRDYCAVHWTVTGAINGYAATASNQFKAVVMG